jgi:hypothetical protein
MMGSDKDPDQVSPLVRRFHDQMRRRVVREVYDHKWVNPSTREVAAFIGFHWPEVAFGKVRAMRSMLMPNAVHWAAYLIGWVGGQADHENEPDVDNWREVDWPTIGWLYHRWMAIASDNEDMIEPEPNGSVGNVE